MIVVGLSHRSAPIAVRERIALSGDALDGALETMLAHEAIDEALILSTCNRTEVYVSAATIGQSPQLTIDAVVDILASLGSQEIVPHLVTRQGHDALLHLFRVAASLDSLVVGEPQILGQVKEAARAAEAKGGLGCELSGALRASLQAAKRVRSETSIGRGQVSVPSVAVSLAEQIFTNLANHRALLIGAGEMAETAAKLLARRGAPLQVVNRSAERAERLAASAGGTPARWEDLESCLVEADIVISSTASTSPVITRSMLEKIRKARRGRSLFLIDIALPRDVAPDANELDGIYLYDIDDLSHVVAQSLEDRAEEAKQAEYLVAEQAQQFADRGARRSIEPIIAGIHERAREIFTRELDRSCRSRLKHLGESERDALEAMLESATNKLLHAPSARLRELAKDAQGQDAAQLLSDLFELDADAAHTTPDRRPLQAEELDDTHDSDGDDEDKVDGENEDQDQRHAG
ncbi:MAG: glutamyl-tRNA reductase [Polyangiaceae bacterium]